MITFVKHLHTPMHNDDLTNDIRKRTEEMTKLLTKLGQQKITEESAYKNIISKLHEEVINKTRHEEEIKKLSGKTETMTFYIINDLKKENNQLKAKLKELQKDKTSIDQTILSVNYANAVNDYKIMKEQMGSDYENSEQMAREYRQMYEASKEENNKLKERCSEYEERLAETVGKYQDYIENFTNNEEKYKTEIETLKSEIVETKQQNVIFADQIKKYTFESEQLYKEVKRLRNELIDMKGQIRVFCRVRPPLNSQNEMYPMYMTQSAVTIDKNQFIFDEVFNHESNQAQIFNEVNFLVDSVYDGYNACIFAYGQTGSGKTHTMEGATNDAGILPRAVRAILSRNNDLRKKEWSVKCIVNFVEIYNEKIKDLLSNEDKKCEIKHENNVTYIKDCEYISLETEEQAFALLQAASQNRSVGYTHCNDRSSRSHSIYTFNLELASKDGKEKITGTINFIDLAGSERLNESGAQGVRLKETQNINKSLSSLGNVLLALMRGECHIPYRNSKLTYYLQNSFSGSARVLMFVNVSPEMRHINETLSSLRFAQKVSECKLGATSKNMTKNI